MQVFKLLRGAYGGFLNGVGFAGICTDPDVSVRFPAVFRPFSGRLPAVFRLFSGRFPGRFRSRFGPRPGPKPAPKTVPKRHKIVQESVPVRASFPDAAWGPERSIWAPFWTYFWPRVGTFFDENC